MKSLSKVNFPDNYSYHWESHWRSKDTWAFESNPSKNPNSANF